MTSIRRAPLFVTAWAFLLLFATSLAASAANLQSITLSPADPAMRAGFTQTFVATGHYDDGSTANVSQTASWKSSNTGVATVVNQFGLKGLVTAQAQGTARISAEIAVGLNVVRGSTSVVVSDGDLVSITTRPTTKNLEVGQVSQFKATANYINGTDDDVTTEVTWSSTNPAVASVSNAAGSKGMVTAHKVGTVTIIALDPASGTTNTDGATNVRAQVSHLSFDPPDVVIGKNIKFPLRVYANRVDGTRSQITEDVEFSVVPAGIITIGTGDQAGIVTAKKNGRVRIAAYDAKRNLSTTSSGTDGKLRVRGRVVAIEVQSNPIRITVGEEKNARAVGLLNNGTRTSDLRRIVQWSIDDPSVATVGVTVNDIGELVGKKSGTTTLRATYGAMQSQEKNNIQVLGNLQSVELEAGDGLIPMNEEVELKARGKYEGNIELNITDRCEWTVVNPNIATIDNAESEVDGDGKGWIKGKALGQTTVNLNCSGKKASAGIRVIGTLVGLEIDPAVYGAEALEEKQFRAWGQYSDGSEKDLTKLVSWSSSDTAVAQIDNLLDPGTVTAIATGSSTLTASKPPFSATAVVAVGAGLVGINVNPPSKTVRGSVDLQLNAVGRRADNSTVPLTKRVVWSSSDPSIARVSNREGEQGLAFGGAAEGTAQIIASLPGTPFTASSSITTQCLLQSLELKPPTKTVPLGQARLVSAHGNFCSGKPKKIQKSVTFHSSNPNVAVVSNDPKAQGTVSGVAVGTTVITAVDNSSGKTSVNSVLVTVIP